jgi:hypothetical protein
VFFIFSTQVGEKKPVLKGYPITNNLKDRVEAELFSAQGSCLGKYFLNNKISN